MRYVHPSAVAALHQYPAIVVDFGTATNFDVVSAKGEYIGGAISPGIGVSHDALVSRTAKLHKVDLEPPPHPIDPRSHLKHPHDTQPQARELRHDEHPL